MLSQTASNRPSDLAVCITLYTAIIKPTTTTSNNSSSSSNSNKDNDNNSSGNDNNNSNNVNVNDGNNNDNGDNINTFNKISTRGSISSRFLASRISQ